MTSYGGWSLGWSGGRRLSTMSRDGTSLLFAYNDEGQRTEKTANGSTHKYIYRGGLLIADICGNDALYFRYDQNGEAVGFLRTLGVNRAEYRYVKNQQGDVVAVIDFAGAEAATYTYDGWGNILTTGGYDADLAARNPLRYRGYYYDSETGLYYVSSRYYDPEIGRFICADTTDFLSATPYSLTDKNLYAYCDNNPVMREDVGGDLWIIIGAGVGALIGGAVSAISQYVTTGEINWKVVSVNAAAGAISGALASTGIGFTASVVSNAVLGGGTYVAEQVVKDENITLSGVLASTVAGGIGGAIGGRGANTKGHSTVWRNASKGIDRELRRANAKYAAKQIARYAAEKTAVEKSIGVAVSRFTLGAVGSTLAKWKFGY